MEPFGAVGTGVVDANSLKDMVGPWGLEPQTSTVSKRGHQVLTRLLGTAKYLIIPSSRTHLGLAFGLKLRKNAA